MQFACFTNAFWGFAVHRVFVKYLLFLDTQEMLVFPLFLEAILNLLFFDTTFAGGPTNVSPRHVIWGAFLAQTIMEPCKNEEYWVRLAHIEQKNP